MPVRESNATFSPLRPPRQWPQLKGQFLVDRDGIVRWAYIECATEGLAGVGKSPSEEEILAAARALPRR